MARRCSEGFSHKEGKAWNGYSPWYDKIRVCQDGRIYIHGHRGKSRYGDVVLEVSWGEAHVCGTAPGQVRVSRRQGCEDVSISHLKILYRSLHNPCNTD